MLEASIFDRVFELISVSSCLWLEAGTMDDYRRQQRMQQERHKRPEAPVASTAETEETLVSPCSRVRK